MATYYWVGGTGTWSGTGNTQFAVTSGGVATLLDPTNADTVNFDANSGTSATITVDSTAVSLSTTIDKADINLSLSGNATLCTTVGTLTLTAGTLTLNNYTLSCGIFNSNNANTRAIDFGIGSINVTGNATTIWECSTLTGFSYSGTPTINFTYSGSTGIRTVNNGFTAGATEFNAVSINVTAGTDTFYTANSYVKNLDFTGSSKTWLSNRLFIYGDLTLPTSTTVSPAGTATINFIAASSVQKITTNNNTINLSAVVGTAGSTNTLQIQDNLTMGSTRTFTLTAGTLDLSSGNRTLSTGLFSSSNSNIRSIAFGTGNITLTGSGTVWTTATPTNFSFTGTPIINISNNSATATTVSTGAMTEAQSLNFNYTTGTYTLTDTAARYRSVNFTGFAGTIPNSVRTIFGSFTLSTGMTLTAGANATTFASTSAGNTITSNGKTQDYPIVFNGIGGVWACQDALTQGSTRAFTFTNGTVELKNGVTSTVGAFATSGTNQKFLQSTLAGSQATLSQASGTVNVSYLSIQDINATGGAIWFAPIDQLNVDVSNNDGWDFFVQLGQYMYTRRKNKRLLIS